MSPTTPTKGLTLTLRLLVNDDDTVDITTRQPTEPPPERLTCVSPGPGRYAWVDADRRPGLLLRITEASLHLPPSFLLAPAGGTSFKINRDTQRDVIRIAFGETEAAGELVVDEISVNGSKFASFLWTPSACLVAVVLHHATPRWAH